jgi:hypothetical protein
MEVARPILKLGPPFWDRWNRRIARFQTVPNTAGKTTAFVYSGHGFSYIYNYLTFLLFFKTDVSFSILVFLL